MLEADGYAVIGEAASGAAAVRESARLGPDIVLLDIGLPDASGLDLVGRPGPLRRARWSCSSPAGRRATTGNVSRRPAPRASWTRRPCRHAHCATCCRASRRHEAVRSPRPGLPRTPSGTAGGADRPRLRAARLRSGHRPRRRLDPHRGRPDRSGRPAVAARWTAPNLAGFLWFVGTPASVPILDDPAFAFQGYFDTVLVLIGLSFPWRWPARRENPRSPGRPRACSVSSQSFDSWREAPTSARASSTRASPTSFWRGWTSRARSSSSSRAGS